MCHATCQLPLCQGSYYGVCCLLGSSLHLSKVGGGFQSSIPQAQFALCATPALHCSALSLDDGIEETSENMAGESLGSPLAGHHDGTQYCETPWTNCVCWGWPFGLQEGLGCGLHHNALQWLEPRNNGCLGRGTRLHFWVAVGDENLVVTGRLAGLSRMNSWPVG